MKQELVFWQRVAGLYNGFTLFSGGAYARMYREILREVGPGSAVLEAAAGTGQISAAVAPQVRRVVCTDAAPNMLRQARKLARRRGLTNVEFSVQDLYGLRLPDESFDAAVAANVLHLLPEPGRAVAELLRVLRPGGALIAPTFVLGSGSRAGRALRP